MEAGELFFKFIFYALIAPFWLAWKVISLSWEFIVKPSIERSHEKSAVKQQEQQQETPKQKARDEARAKQLDALKAAVPPGPPERMRATIQINEYKKARMEQQRISHLVGEHSFVYAEVGEDTCFSVDMILEMTETERAIIKQHELDDIVLDESATYSDMDIIEAKRRQHDELKGTKDPLLVQIKADVGKEVISDMQKDRTKTRVGDLIVAPFSRPFDSPHKAKEYADKLKTKFLPEVRKLLDGYSAHKQTETLEF
jgi:hypothetical protein